MTNLPTTPEPAPLVWRPMKTCPRYESGVLHDDVWVAHEYPLPTRRFNASEWVELPQESDDSYGLVGWLPGDIDEADLPEVPQ